MFQIGFALIANCVSLNMYKKTEMPQWVRVLFLHYLARMLCIDTGYPKADVRKTRRVDVKVRNKKFLNQVWGFEHVLPVFQTSEERSIATVICVKV